MNTWKEKLDIRYNALKNISKDLVELAWLLFAAIQWILAIVLPSFFVASIICYIADKPLTMTVYDMTLNSFWGYFLTYFSFLVYTGFAYYYLFKIRKKGEPSTHYKFNLMFLYLAIYLLFAYRVELAEKNYILENIRYSETTVRLYDSNNKHQLEMINWTMTGHSGDSILPLEYSVASSSDHSAIIRLVDIKPMEMEFSATGYQPKKVFVGTEEGSHTVSVYLEKENLKDPNLPANP